MKLKDTDYLWISVILGGITAFVSTLDILTGFIITLSIWMVGGIIVYIRRGLLKVKHKLEEKKQAV